ncbi:T9SS type A sorting domain-containing protein [Flavobacteriaceae bacterium]|nr:T9SS type A sorting domain-containing protein [Flavobacteriaceae bacterium]MDB4256444.1 T9SS type A sorting domain-containing protein [Flavobacteriaceae bacterium]MDC0636979.1 T9SS type A sorting domain-containing protein [Flavobacteriaceae bacterium]
MKKTLLILFLITSSSLFAQSFSTGTQTLTSGLTANINIDNDTGTTTLTLAGPSNKWFGIGFGNSNMNGTDIFMTNGSSIRDAYSTSNGQPQADSSPESGDWTLVSNTVSSSTRTIVATRANDTGNSNDHTFSASAGSLNVIWAIGASSQYSSGHSNRSATTLSVSLGISENNLLNFEMYPNPVSDLLNIQLPTGTEKAEVGVFDYTGRLVSSKTISSNDTAIDVQKISKGIYMIRVATNTKIGVQRFIKK